MSERNVAFATVRARPSAPTLYPWLVTLASAAIAADLAPSGTLRASVNLGNPVLAQGTPSDPRGVTVDIARELGDRLSLPVSFACFDAARKSFEAMRTGQGDLCFLAPDPARAQDVAFTAPYVLIEGVYAVRADSPVATATDVDRPGTRVGVKQGSAYDLFLSRSLERASVVRGREGTEVFEAAGLEVAAGIRQPVTAYVAARGAMRVVEPAFMQIRQAVGVPRQRRPETQAFLGAFVEELKESGFVAQSLRRSGQDATVAPPA